MIIAAWIVGSILLYVVGLSFTGRYADKNISWNTESIWLASIFGWPLLLMGVVAFNIHKKSEIYFNHRKVLRDREREIKALPPIYIKKKAKIEEFKQYQLLKKMCSDFEIENDLDNLLSQ